MIWYYLKKDHRITKIKMLRKNHWSAPGKCLPQNLASLLWDQKILIPSQEAVFPPEKGGKTILQHLKENIWYIYHILYIIIHIVCIGVSTPLKNNNPLFLAKPPLKSANCPSPLFRQSTPVWILNYDREKYFCL